MEKGRDPCPDGRNIMDKGTAERQQATFRRQSAPPLCLWHGVKERDSSYYNIQKLQIPAIF